MSTPLFDELIAGRFNNMHWRDFLDICERIVKEGGKTVPDMHEAIIAYLMTNEPEGCYNIPHENKTVQWPDMKVILFSTIRKVLKIFHLLWKKKEFGLFIHNMQIKNIS